MNWFEPILRKAIKDESSLVFLLPASQETQLLEEVFQLWDEHNPALCN
jgi:hypothetical protein